MEGGEENRLKEIRCRGSQLPILRLSRYGNRAAHNNVGVHLTEVSDNRGGKGGE